MTSELKTCPFCGGDAEYYTDNGPTGEVYGWVGCNQCDAMSCHIDVRSMQPEEAHPIDAWNTRAEQAAELAKFKTLADALVGALEAAAYALHNISENYPDCMGWEPPFPSTVSSVLVEAKAATQALRAYEEFSRD